jgi:hypothetical protein
MAGTFSQVYIQVVFAVRGRENLIAKTWQDELHKYISALLKGKNKNQLLSMVFQTTSIALLA